MRCLLSLVVVTVVTASSYRPFNYRYATYRKPHGFRYGSYSFRYPIRQRDSYSRRTSTQYKPVTSSPYRGDRELPGYGPVNSHRQNRGYGANRIDQSRIPQYSRTSQSHQQQSAYASGGAAQQPTNGHRSGNHQHNSGYQSSRIDQQQNYGFQGSRIDQQRIPDYRQTSRQTSSYGGGSRVSSSPRRHSGYQTNSVSQTYGSSARSIDQSRIPQYQNQVPNQQRNSGYQSTGGSQTHHQGSSGYPTTRGSQTHQGVPSYASSGRSQSSHQGNTGYQSNRVTERPHQRISGYSAHSSTRNPHSGYNNQRATTENSYRQQLLTGLHRPSGSRGSSYSPGGPGIAQPSHSHSSQTSAYRPTAGPQGYSSGQSSYSDLLPEPSQANSYSPRGPSVNQASGYLSSANQQGHHSSNHQNLGTHGSQVSSRRTVRHNSGSSGGYPASTGHQNTAHRSSHQYAPASQQAPSVTRYPNPSVSHQTAHQRHSNQNAYPVTRNSGHQSALSHQAQSHHPAPQPRQTQHPVSHNQHQKAKFVQTSSKPHPCKSQKDCFNFREPSEWCPQKYGEKWTSQGCFCDVYKGSCVHQRQRHGMLEEAYCASHYEFKCVEHHPVKKI